MRLGWGPVGGLVEGTWGEGKGGGGGGKGKKGHYKAGKSYGCFVFPYVGYGYAAIRLLSLSGISYVLTLRSSR